MAEEITSPQIVRFCNDKIRPLADVVHDAYYRALVLVKDFESGGIEAHFGKAASDDLVVDGSETDGRTRLSREDVELEYKLLTEFIDFLGQEVTAGRTRLEIIAKAHVN